VSDRAATRNAPAPFVRPPWDTSGPRVRDVRVILTAPDGIRLVVVKVETDEPGSTVSAAPPSPSARWR
jgi:hypothetical protein